MRDMRNYVGRNGIMAMVRRVHRACGHVVRWGEGPWEDMERRAAEADLDEMFRPNATYVAGRETDCDGRVFEIMLVARFNRDHMHIAAETFCDTEWVGNRPLYNVRYWDFWRWVNGDDGCAANLWKW